MDPATYFRNGNFSPGAQVELWLLNDPFSLSAFELTIPVPMVDTCSKPGPELLGMYLDLHRGGRRERVVPAADEDETAQRMRKRRAEADIADFNRFMTEKAQTDVPDVRLFDCMDETVAAARRSANSTCAMDAGGFTMSYDCSLERLKKQTTRVREDVICKWRIAALADGKLSAGEIASRFTTASNELLKLHLVRLDAILRSTTDAASLPAGFLDWHKGLLAELEANSGSASVAFRSGRFGRQKANVDQSVFGELWALFGTIYSDICQIAGRDRRVLDQCFFTVFEVFTPVTFICVLSGVRGNGKSLRSERLASLFPPGVFADAGSATPKAGMNGTSRATDGRVMLFDEAPADLMSKDSQRVEFWKQANSGPGPRRSSLAPPLPRGHLPFTAPLLAAQTPIKRSYTHERTVASDENGVERFKTVKILTRHRSSYIVCSNHGTSLTPADANASFQVCDSRLALADRLVFEVVRPTANCKNSSDADYKAIAGSPLGKELVSLFRTITCLAGMTWMAIGDCGWLLPDVKHANAVFERLDNMLVKQFGLPAISPRKAKRREQIMQTCGILEAVARVYLFKETAVEFEVGRPRPNGTPRPFELSDLASVIKTISFSPEVMLFAWSFSLDYNVSTSSVGAHVLSSVAQHFGLATLSIARDSLASRSVKSIYGNETLKREVENEARRRVEAVLEAMESHAEKERQQGARLREPSSFEIFRDCGICPGAQNLARKIADYVRQASSSIGTGTFLESFLVQKQGGLTKAEAVDIAKQLQRRREERTAFRLACMGASTAPMGSPLEFIRKGGFDDVSVMPSAVEATVMHSADTLMRWSLKKPADLSHFSGTWNLRCDRIKFKELNSEVDHAAMLQRTIDFSTLADPKIVSFRDLARQCISHGSSVQAFGMSEAATRDIAHLLSTTEGVRPCTSAPELGECRSQQLAQVSEMDTPLMYGANHNQQAKLRTPVDVRDLTDGNLEDYVHAFCSSGRLPALNSLFSNRVTLAPVLNIGTNGLEVSVSGLLSHLSLVAEASVGLLQLPGADAAESFAPQGVNADHVDGLRNDAVQSLSFAWDSVSVYLTYAASKLLVDDVTAECIANAATEYDLKNSVEMTSRYTGFSELRRLITFPRQQAAPDVFDDVQTTTEHEITIEDAVARMGRAVTDAEFEEIKASTGSSSAMTGNPLLFSTYLDCLATSWVDKGFIEDDTDTNVAIAADFANLRVQRVHHASAAAGAADGETPGDHAQLGQLLPLAFATFRHGPAARKRGQQADQSAAKRSKRAFSAL